MLLSYKSIELNVEYLSDFHPEAISILLIHGFTGSALDWKDFAKKADCDFNLIALDLIGHGKSSSPPNIQFYKKDEIVEQILFIINHLKIEKPILCGYSMGGRAALCFSSVYPDKLRALILESSSAGLGRNEERKGRAENDEKIAAFIESNSIEDFVDKWMDMEIFKTQKRLPLKKLRDLKLAKMKNSRIGLVNSLRGFGTGVMPYLGTQINNITFPVLLLTGSLDSKFTNINNQLVLLFPNATHNIIEGAGHNIHFEKQSKFISVIKAFLKQF